MSLEGLLEKVTLERDNIKDAYERSKREMLNHSLEVTLNMKEEIEVLKDETDHKQNQVDKLEKAGSKMEQEVSKFEPLTISLDGVLHDLERRLD
jgi:chromosome segregation ATPase